MAVRLSTDIVGVLGGGVDEICSWVVVRIVNQDVRVRLTSWDVEHDPFF